MKKYIVSLSLITALFFTTQVKAQGQAKTYEDASTLIEELLKNPDVSAADKEILKEALKANKEVLKQLKSPDMPVYSTKPPIKDVSNNAAPTAKRPRPTPVISGQNNNRSSGKTLISSQAN
ncbi:MAG: hypothetical protein QM640_12015 [Niabella sp.]